MSRNLIILLSVSVFLLLVVVGIFFLIPRRDDEADKDVSGKDTVTKRCVSGGPANRNNYYIMTGGTNMNNPNYVGWENGDKCCQIKPGSCYWFSSLAQCQANLDKPCSG